MDLGLKTFKAELLKNLKIRFMDLQELDVYAFATFLDPRFKIKMFDVTSHDIMKSKFTKFVVDTELGEPHMETQRNPQTKSTPDYQGPLNIAD